MSTSRPPPPPLGVPIYVQPLELFLQRIDCCCATRREEPKSPTTYQDHAKNTLAEAFRGKMVDSNTQPPPISNADSTMHGIRR